jgi:hypothetical protein
MTEENRLFELMLKENPILRKKIENARKKLKAYRRAYRQRPEYKAYCRAYRQRPECKAHRRAYYLNVIKPRNMRENKMKCKHEYGWLIKDNVSVFLHPNNKLSFDFGDIKNKSYKLKFKCNIPDCSSTRNLYITGKVVKWGRIKSGNKKVMPNPTIP